jgi:regulatory protein
MLTITGTTLASLSACHYLSAVPSRERKKLATETQLYTSAVRALMRRAHSVSEMRKYLEGRAEDAAAVKPVLARLRENRYLDDQRYAIDFARYRANSRHQGRFRIACELRARGVAGAQIEAALDTVFADTDEAAEVCARIARKLRQFHGAFDERKTASLYRSLLRAGFSGDVIRSELRAAKIEVAAALEEAGEESPES